MQCLFGSLSSFQCCGSMTFWGGSGSGPADPCLWLMDPDPDPSIFLIDLQDASKNQFFNTIFSAYNFLKLHLHHFSKIKIQKESQNRRNQGFSYYFCTMIEGSGSGYRAGSGSGFMPLTSGSGSGSWRPKNTWIRWIRIRIRIRNTASFYTDWDIGEHFLYWTLKINWRPLAFFRFRVRGLEFGYQIYSATSKGIGN